MISFKMTRTNTLAGILSTFEQTIADLKALTDAHVARQDAIHAEMARLSDESGVLFDEIEKADRVTDRLKELVA